jgi:pimeloyl-ACP methyl ester carboxylesterase
VKIFLLAVVAVVVLVIVAGAVLYFTGNGIRILALFGPRHGWDLTLKAPAPDYAEESAWAALPAKSGLAAFVPAGVEPPPTDPQVDVFFIHPTGYMGRADWNSPLDANSQTEENTRWMIANQASAYNGCCAVYAPRYREASIFRYISATPELYKKSGDFAYDDVDRAFTYFLEHYSKGRPFIIAGHSQGTEHGWNLVRRRIDGTPLAQRMVAAYLIGGNITDKEVASLKSLHACSSPTDLHCIIHWATYKEGTQPVRNDTKDKLLCINPLSWQRDGPPAPASLNQGAVPMSGSFLIRFWAGDKAQGVSYAPLKAPLKAWTGAACRGGLLFAKDQTGTEFARGAFGDNYHGLDYALFAMNIRENAKARVAAYLSQARSQK